MCISPVTTLLVLGAKRALKHAEEREADIRATFSQFQFSASDYAVLAGFNESLIQLGIGYLQEIHVFILVDIPLDSLLISELGRIFSPSPGVLFTPSSSYQTPVFKDDGTVWDWNEFAFSMVERHSDIRATGMMSQDTIISISGSPQTSSAGNSVSVGSDPNHVGSSGGGDQDNDGDRDHEDRDSEDQEDQSGGDGDPNGGDLEDTDVLEDAHPSIPAVSFDVQARLYVETSEKSSKLFQALKAKGKLVARVCPRLACCRTAESNIYLSQM